MCLPTVLYHVIDVLVARIDADHLSLEKLEPQVYLVSTDCPQFD